MDNINWLGMVVLSITGLLFVFISYLKKNKVDFSLITILSLIIGVLLGLAFKNDLEYIQPIGKIYVNIITFIVVPVISISIISSVIALKDRKSLKTIGVKSIGWLLASAFFGILLALIIGIVFKIGKNSSLIINGIDSSTLTDRVTPFTDVIVNLFPSNIVTNIASNNIVAIIIVSLAIAIGYIAVSEKKAEQVKPFKDFIEATKLIIYKILRFIVALTPYAILVLTANAVSTAAGSKEVIVPLLILLVITYVVCALHTFGVNALLIGFVAKLNVFKFFKKISNSMITAFTTQSSVGTLPVTIDNLQNKVGVSSEITNITAPLGTTVGMPGCSGIWPILLAVYTINALGINYSVTDYITLGVLALVLSLGTAGVPGTATIAATALFAAAGLPVEAIILLLPISTIADMARTTTNVTAAAVTATIVAKQEKQLYLDVFNDETKPEDIIKGENI